MLQISFQFFHELVAKGIFMYLRRIMFFGLLGMFFSIFTLPILADEQKVRDLIKTKFPSATLEQVNKVKDIDLYELVIDGDVIYIDLNLQYFIDGNLIDLSNMQNVTRERKGVLETAAMEKLKIPLVEFPLEWAVKKVHGDGSRKMAYFADPNCGYCKRFEKTTIPKIENVTIYIFPYPIISEKSLPLTQSIWCSSNREAAWDDYVRKGISPSGSKDCDNPIENVLAFGKKMRIRGTPTLFFGDGTRVSGMMGLQELDQKLNENM